MVFTTELSPLLLLGEGCALQGKGQRCLSPGVGWSLTAFMPLSFFLSLLLPPPKPFESRGRPSNSQCIDASRWSSTWQLAERFHVSFPQNREGKCFCALSMSQLRNQVPGKLKGLLRAPRSGGFAITEPRKASSLPICACWG